MPLLSVGQIKLSSGFYQPEALSSEVDASNADAELKTKVQQAPAEPLSTALIRDEFLNYSQKYMGLIDRTLQQLQSEFHKSPLAPLHSRGQLHTGIMDIFIVLRCLFNSLL